MQHRTMTTKLWDVAAIAVAADVYTYLHGNTMSKLNWRDVNENRITTKYEEIWLWDNELAVSIPWTTGGKQLRNVSPAFTKWMPKISDDEPSPPITEVSKEQFSARMSAALEENGDCPF